MLSATLLAVRRICTELRPSELDNIGLDAAIESYAREFQERTGVKCRARLRRTAIPADALRVGIVFRIFQEALTNVARHARATEVRISLRLFGGLIVLEVKDDGIGFSASVTTDHRTLGILGMKERALACGGSVDIVSTTGQGTAVTVRIPMAEPPKE